MKRLKRAEGQATSEYIVILAMVVALSIGFYATMAPTLRQKLASIFGFNLPGAGGATAVAGAPGGSNATGGPGSGGLFGNAGPGNPGGLGGSSGADDGSGSGGFSTGKSSGTH